MATAVAAVAVMASALLVGSGANRPPAPTAVPPTTIASIARVEVETPTLCVTGGASTTPVRAVVIRPELVLAVELEVTRIGTNRTTTFEMRPAPSADGSGMRTYIASVGPFDREGSVGYAVRLTDRRGQSVRSSSGQIAVRAAC